MVKNWIKATGFLFLLWLILSGHFGAKYVLLGFSASAVIVFFCLPGLWIAGKDTEKKYSLLDLSLWRVAGYWLWLLGEIVKSSLGVARAVLSPGLKIQPQIVRFQCVYQNPVAVTMLVNSIILTPGTVTVDTTKDDWFVVHALTDEAAKGLLDGRMQKRIGRLFGEQIEIRGN